MCFLLWRFYRVENGLDLTARECPVPWGRDPSSLGSSDCVQPAASPQTVLVCADFIWVENGIILPSFQSSSVLLSICVPVDRSKNTEVSSLRRKKLNHCMPTLCKILVHSSSPGLWFGELMEILTGISCFQLPASACP